MFSFRVPFYWCKFVIFIQCSAFASSIFVNWNIDLIIGSGTSFLGNVFKTSIFIVVFLYGIWFIFNHVNHMVSTYLRTCDNLQLLSNSIGGCKLPTKCTAIILDNDYRHVTIVIWINLLCFSINYFSCF